ncbi:polyphenol oxidase family protein [Zhihengliuella sp.]|uniref:polyphenol oxidase family protein n=1 Tax=Zhihengliuella sp. TaxID=1954483 RepID=UPI0028111489|nr:polyphenol oxidase family protein [Zhihengliuella sp.]
MLQLDAGTARRSGLVPRVAFTTVAEGNLALHVDDDAQAVHRRRAAVAAALGADRVHYMNQVHSADVAVVPGVPDADARRAEDPSVADAAPTADALVTGDDGAALAVMVADCVPVVLVGVPARPGTGSAGREGPDGAEGPGGRDGHSGVVRAVAHAGRRGLLSGILPATVARMRAVAASAHQGSRPDGPVADADAGLEITAWIGPSICGACYEVPEAMARQAEAEQPGISATTSWGTASLDLPGAAAAQLRSGGVAVVPSGICTLEDARFYSYRRDSRCGRFAGLAWMGPASGDRAGTAADTTGGSR